MKKLALFIVLLIICLGGIGLLFWSQEYKYTLPTPVPENLQSVAEGDTVILPFRTDKQNVFLHFYNYDCPCSRFNITEFQSMVRRYADDVEFFAILQTSDTDKEAVKKFREKYDLGIGVIEDPQGKVAAELGVYSTPQAVLIRNGRIYYKGNYNRARFCLSRNTKFAEMALTAMVRNEPAPAFPEQALVAYGCELPSNQSNNNNLFSIF